MRVLVVIVLVVMASAVIAETGAPPEMVVNRCQTCHGPSGVGAIPGWPAIAGLPAAEFSSKLKGYRGRNNPESVMAEAAHDLSDEEIEQLAKYYEQLGR